MNARFRRAANYLFSSFLTLFFLYFAFRGTDFEALTRELSQANYWWALAMIPPLLISHLFRAWRWKYLLLPVKRQLSFRNLFSAMSIGYLINNILPKVGEIVRPHAIGKLENVSRSAAFGTLLVERIFDILSFLVLVAMIPLVYKGPLLQTFPWLKTTGIWATVLTLGFVAIVAFLLFRRDLLMRFLSLFTRHLSAERSASVERISHSFLDGFLFLKEPGSFLPIGIMSVIVWGLYIVMMYFPFRAFGMTEHNSLDFSSALVVQAISSIGYMAPTPGATGPYHYFTVQTLTKLYGVEDNVARSYAVVTHALGYISTSCIGLYFLLRDRLHVAELIDAKTPADPKDPVA